jgi:putative sugar O-methyltransferase
VVTSAGSGNNTFKERVIHAVLRFTPKRLLRVMRRICEAGEITAAKSHIEGMMVESVENVPDNETAIVSRLMASFNAAKKAQGQVPEPYLPGADWKKMLESEWGKYHEACRTENIAVIAPFLRNFFRNEGLSGFWGNDRMFELFAGCDGLSGLRRAHLMSMQFEAWRAELPSEPVSKLAAPKIGNPWGYVIEGQLVYEPVCEYHYQAHYFSRLLTEIAKPVILEIGGGFGGLAYYILKRIPGVTYLGFDLPENIFLQSYYLSCAFPELKILTYDASMTALTRDTIAAYDIVLLPNFMLQHVESAAVDLAVNVRSLSEMPAQTISEYLRQIDRVSRLYFFHENIFKPRADSYHGIVTSEFPPLCNFLLVAESESRWPRYRRDTGYPCHEHLYVHRSAVSIRPEGRP